jgi:hypothetical protein
MGKNPDRDKHPRSYFQKLRIIFVLKILTFFVADPDPGSCAFLALDPGFGMEKFGSGIRDKHSGSTHLFKQICLLFIVRSPVWWAGGHFVFKDARFQIFERRLDSNPASCRDTYLYVLCAYA